MKEKYRIILLIYIIVIAVFLSLYPSLRNEFLGWDDDFYVTRCSVIKSLNAENIFHIFTTFHESGNYHPLTLISLSLDYHIFGLSPRAFHTTNLILHLINTILVFYLILLLSNNLFVSSIVSLFFGIHPLHIESVAWISERKDLLYSLFYLAGLILYIQYLRSKKLSLYFLIMILFLLSLLSKAMAVTFPIILLIFDYYFNVKIDRSSIAEKIPFFLMAIIFGVINIFAQRLAAAINRGMELSILHNFLIACHGIIFYLQKLILPINLSAFYPYPANKSDILSYEFLVSPLILIAVIILLIRLKIHSRKILFGFLFFIVTILPVLKFIPVGGASAADRYTYIPYIGLLYLAAEGFNYLFSKKYYSSKILKSLLIVFLVSIAICFGVLSHFRCYIWQDDITLWEDVIIKHPYTYVPYNNIGVHYIQEGEYQKAKSYLDKSLKLYPLNPDALYNSGLVHYNIKDFQKSVEQYSKAIDLKPDFCNAYNNRGNSYLKLGENEKAKADFKTALKLNNSTYKEYIARADFHFNKGEYENALLFFNILLDNNINYEECLYKRAMCYKNLNQYEKALADLNALLKTNPDNSQIISLINEIKNKK